MVREVFPFFDKYSLILKKNDFEKFKLVLDIMEKKGHLAKPSLKRIFQIAFTMNSSGKYRKLSLDDILSSL